MLEGGLVVGAAGVAWSILGLVPVRGPAHPYGRAPVGVALVAVGLAGLAFAITSSGGFGVVVAIVAGGVIGVGMGMAYTVQGAANLNGLEPTQVATVATAAAFAETASISLGSLLTGGSYSLATSSGAAAAPTLALGFLILAALAVLTLWPTVFSLQDGARGR